MRLPYLLSEELGVEILLGSDKVLTPGAYMAILRGEERS